VDVAAGAPLCSASVLVIPVLESSLGDGSAYGLPIAIIAHLRNPNFPRRQLVARRTLRLGTRNFHLKRMATCVDIFDYGAHVGLGGLYNPHIDCSPISSRVGIGEFGDNNCEQQESMEKIKTIDVYRRPTAASVQTQQRRPKMQKGRERMIEALTPGRNAALL
jgi:hypothetical protein